jgi:hypothetical protein
VIFGPSVWQHRLDGLRVGAWVRTWRPGYGGLVPGDGRPQLDSGISYGSKSGHLNYSAEYSDHLGIGRLGRWETGAWQKEGKGEFYLGARWSVAPKLTTWDRRQRVALRLSRYTVFESGYGNPLDWADGASNSLSAQWQLESRSHHWENRLSASLRKAVRMRDQDADFAKGSLAGECRRARLPGPCSSLRARAFAAAILAGSEPLQEKIDIGGESPIGADRFFALNEGGPVRRLATGGIPRFHLAGGPELRGYWDRGIAADRFIAANLEAGLPMGVFAFFDAGSGWRTREPSSGNDYGRRILSDAGLGLRAAGVVFNFPLWLSHPRGQEAHAKLRWNFQMATEGVGF